jgi:ABC-type transport system substrate-binding protein
MNPSSRNTSLMVARTSVAVLMLSFAAFVVWTAGDLRGQAPAQKPRVEEEEDTPKPKEKSGKKQRVEEEEETSPKKPKRKIRPEEEEDPKEKAEPNRPGAKEELAKLAERETQPAIKALYRSLAVPYDLVLYKRTTVKIGGEKIQGERKIEPTPIFLGTDPSRFSNEQLRFTPYTFDWKPDKPFSPLLENLQFVRPYEEIAQDKVRQFLREATPDNSDARSPLSSYDKLVAAENVLKAVLNWHESAKLTGGRNYQRSGEDWKKVEANLRKQLLEEVKMEQLKELAQKQEWEKVVELARDLANTYKDKRDIIFRPIADMIKSALRGQIATEEKRREALKRLRELEREFPGNEELQPLSDALQKEAQSYFETAQDLAKEKKVQQALDYVRRAEEIYPQLKGLGKLKMELNLEHPILRVGVRGPMPQFFSPAWARTDNERRIVDLLFESLVKLVPDQAGGYRYCRGLSESKPQVATLGRRFELPHNATWSDNRTITSADVEFSLKLLQAGKGVGRSSVWGELFLAAERKGGPFRVTLQLRQGFLDPLGLMTFKILPANQKVNLEEFAKNPVTSGPFHLKGMQSEDGRQSLVFTANPEYGSRPTKNNAPHIQEIRFYTSTNPVEEISNGKLDLVLDLTAKEAADLLDKPSIEVPLPSPNVPNRRIYFLAINTVKLSDAGLRRAISCAIDREKLLDQHFRAPLKGKAQVHKALNGPFPAGSWACKQNQNAPADKAGPSLFNPEEARLLSQQPAAQRAAETGRWQLKYPTDDPALEEAIKELCAQVKTHTGVVLEPKPISLYDLHDDIVIHKNFDLAYYYYDFPDETYWLAPLFGPPPGSADDSMNIFKYRTDDLSNLLSRMRIYRDFSKVREYQWEIHNLLNREMPFIPLWQLDPLLAYRREVQPAAFDPLLVFNNIEEWRLMPRK